MNTLSRKYISTYNKLLYGVPNVNKFKFFVIAIKYLLPIIKYTTNILFLVFY